MLSTQPFMRDDTFFGVCHALGEDLGFPPDLLRIALAPVLIWYPLSFAGVYLAAATMIFLLRWAVPNPEQAPAPRPAEPALDLPAEDRQKLPIAA